MQFVNQSAKPDLSTTSTESEKTTTLELSPSKKSRVRRFFRRESGIHGSTLSENLSSSQFENSADELAGTVGGQIMDEIDSVSISMDRINHSKTTLSATSDQLEELPESSQTRRSSMGNEANVVDVSTASSSQMPSSSVSVKSAIPTESCDYPETVLTEVTRKSSSVEQRTATSSASTTQASLGASSKTKSGSTLDSIKDNIPSYTYSLSDLVETEVDINSPWYMYFAHIFRQTALRGGSTESTIIWSEMMWIMNVITDGYLVSKLLIATILGLDTVYCNGIALTLFGATYLISWICYISRGLIIYHRIPQKNQILFVPGMVFKTVRNIVSEGDIESLLMYDRLMFTFSLLMRFLEDIPQVLFVLNYLSEEADLLIVISIALSIFNVVQSTCRLGYLYPWKDTIALMISKAPPVDERPGVIMASPTTSVLPAILTIVAKIFTIAYAISANISRGYRSYYYGGMSLLFGSITIICGWYALYLRKEYRTHNGPQSYEMEMRPLLSAKTIEDSERD